MKDRGGFLDWPNTGTGGVGANFLLARFLSAGNYLPTVYQHRNIRTTYSKLRVDVNGPCMFLKTSMMQMSRHVTLTACNNTTLSTSATCTAVTTISPRARCDTCGGSPIVIDVGDGISLTGPENGVDFDLNGNGTRDRRVDNGQLRRFVARSGSKHKRQHR